MASEHTWNRDGLPAWSYRSASLLELEKDKVFLNHWHVVGHVNDLKQPGDWLSFDLLGERALVMRGQDAVIRAFHNTAGIVVQGWWKANRGIVGAPSCVRFMPGSTHWKES